MAADCITDDFVFRGWAPRPLNKGEFLAIQNELRTALTGYSFNLSDLNGQDSELPVPPRLREIKQLGDTDISQEIEEHQAPEWGHETPITDIDTAVDAG